MIKVYTWRNLGMISCKIEEKISNYGISSDDDSVITSSYSQNITFSKLLGNRYQ